MWDVITVNFPDPTSGELRSDWETLADKAGVNLQRTRVE